MKKMVSIFYKPFLETNDLNDRAKAYAATRGIEYEWIKIPEDQFTNEKAICALKDADCGLIDTQVFDKAIFSQINHRCKLIIRYGVGYDAVNLEDAKKYGVRVARTTGANALAVAEMAITMMLTLSRRIIAAHLTDKFQWKTVIGENLSGKTVGILGFGAVGQALAKLLQGFGCVVYAYDMYHDDAAAKQLGVRFAELDQILEESDIISCHLALNEETKELICRETIDRMKDGVIIINTARGGLIDDNSLIDAIKSGKVGGAGLDVFSTEPLPMESEYRGLENVVLTSHMASASIGGYWNIYKTAIDAAADYFEGHENKKMMLI